MANEIEVTASGTGALDSVLNMIDAIDASDQAVERARVELTLSAEARASTDTEGQQPVHLRPNTNLHTTLELVFRYLEATGDDAVTRSELAEFTNEEPLSVTQLGNALNNLAHNKGLLNIKQEDEGVSTVNHYSPTSAAVAERERLTPPEALQG